MKMKTRMLPGLVLLYLLPALSRADDGLALVPGTRVRVASGTAANQRLVGTVFAIDEDSLTLMNDDHHTVKLPRSVVTQLEVSWGRKSHWWQGMLIGAAVGAGIGIAEGPTCDSYGCYSRAQNTTYGSLGMAALGAVIGKLIKSDRWAGISLEPARASTRSRAAPATPRMGAPGLAVSMSVRF